MKKIKYISLIGSLLLVSAGFQSCDLEEYNPSGTTADVVFATPEGIETLVNATYFNFRWKFFGREDPVLYLEGGTDLWMNAELSTYGRQMTKYEDLSSKTGQIANVWNRLYDNINLCNAGINRIEDIQYTNPTEKKYREGELRFIRAYSYWWLVEFFGDIDMRLKETNTIELKCYRTPLETIYDEVIIPDLQKACNLLLPDPIDGMVGRATQKAAYGMLARAALTRAAYGDADKYNTIARDAAVYVIQHQNELKVSLYDKYADLFDPKNNKKNKEAMFVVTHSTNAALNPNPKNANRMFSYFNPKYVNFVGCEMSLEHGKDNEGPRMMPTKYLLKLFKEEDARYAATFLEVFKCNKKGGYTWTEADRKTFAKPMNFVGSVKVNEGDTALYYTRNSVGQEWKDKVRYAIVDVDMVYDKTTGAIKATSEQYSRFFPKLQKYQDPDRLTANSTEGTKDVVIMRLAEMYLIAADAEIALGQPGKALPYIQDLRKRALIPGKEAAMAVTVADMTPEFMLEERARELCGEFMRWFDLKRTKKLVSNVKAHNPNITLIQEYHMLRPIPETFLNTILNRSEFGQNEGYAAEAQ